MSRAFHTPTDRVYPTRSGRFVFVMLAVAPGSTDHEHYVTGDICEEPKIRRKYKVSGLYPAGGTAPLWTVDWYAQLVDVCEDGRHLVRWGQLSFQPKLDTALYIYRVGRLLKSFPVSELVLKPGNLAVTNAGYWWLQEHRLEGDSGPLYLRTKHAEEYRFDLLTGKIAWKALPSPGDLIVDARTPDYWQRVLTGATVLEGDREAQVLLALEHLGKVGGQQSSAVHAIAAFLKDPRPAVQLATAAALETMAEFAWPARGALLAAFEGRDAALSMAALRALAAAGLAEEADLRRLLPHLTSAGEEARALIAKIIAGAGVLRRNLLRELLPLLRPQAAARLVVADVALAGLGRDLEPLARALLELARDADPLMRRAAGDRLAEVAAASASEPAIGALAAALADPDARVSRRAVQILGELGTRAAAALPQLEALKGRSTGSLTRATERAIRLVRGQAVLD